MKWILYIAIWLYGLAVTGLGFASILNPINADSVAGGRIPTDIFTIIGIIILYFAYASKPQHFYSENREVKRFDLLMIGLLTAMMTVIPLLFVGMLTKNVLGNWATFSHEAGFMTSFIGILAATIISLLSLVYSIRIFLYNK